MKMKTLLLSAVILLGGTTVFNACSADNSDNPLPPTPPESTQPKISKFYTTNSYKLEQLDAATNEWVTFSDEVDERKLSKELFWTGNRLDSLKEGTSLWTFTYGAGDRPTGATRFSNSTPNGSYVFEYDSKGRISRVILTTSFIDLHSIVTDDYIYDGDKLQTIKVTNDVPREEERTEYMIKREELHYIWQGDNVVSTVNHREYYKAQPDSVVFNYEYSDMPNPLYGNFAVLAGIISSYIANKNLTDGLSKNFFKLYDSGNYKEHFEVVSGSNRVESYRITSETITAGVVRTYINNFYELEYTE